MSASQSLARWAPFAVLAFGILAVFLAYQLGLTGALYYDDHMPLSRLERVDGLGSALYYTFSDTSGHLGRPLSMVTFLIHAEGWPDNTLEILRFNVVLHVFNGLLVAAVALSLLNLMRGRQSTNPWLATGAALLWVIMPMQVSTSLIAIQRMAGLSAFFVFAGLWVYLRGLSIQTDRPRLGLTLQAIGLGLFTVLAMFAKENGVLLPIFALVIELTLLAGCVQTMRWRKARLALLGVALCALLAYLGLLVLNTNSYLGRDFTLPERLMTQPQILWEYLRLALLPRTFAFSPFHDDYTHVESLLNAPLALLAATAWIVLFVAAVVLRRRFPVAAFAVLWFLAAHLLESTVIPLELYFEHRNYVALFGPCLAIAWIAPQIMPKRPRFSVVVFGAFVVLQGLMLIQVTSLWGNRTLAAEMWFMEQTGSERAATHLAAIYNNEHRAPEVALRILDQNIEVCPSCLAAAVQATALSCLLENEAAFRQRVNAVMSESQLSAIGAGVPTSLQTLHSAVAQGVCPVDSWRLLEDLNRKLMENPRVHPYGKIRQALHMNLYAIYSELDRRNEALNELDQAWRIDRDHGVAYSKVALLIELGRIEEAVRFTENEMCEHMPAHPVLAYAARARCDDFRERVRDSASIRTR